MPNTRPHQFQWYPPRRHLQPRQHLRGVWRLWCLLLISLMHSACATPPLPKASTLTRCPTGAPVETDGIRKLAFLVGVGQYQSPGVTDLAGPPNDVQHLFDVLTGPGGFGFPKENVCVLTNEEATTTRFKELFERALVHRARAGDVALFYFAGHGSQARDKNGDEPDEWDETLLLHDAHIGNVTDVLDDELNAMLARLNAKTQNITMILDACNSGSASRGDFVARYSPPDLSSKGSDSGDGGGDDSGDGRESWIPNAMPGAVFVSAAADGTSALELNGQGLFTQALLETVAERGTSSLTWRDVSLRMPPRLKALRTPQIPYFQGAMNSQVFDRPGAATPSLTSLQWNVKELKGDDIILSGPPWLSGWSKGAEVRVYRAKAAPADLKDPRKAIAALEVVDVKGPVVTARRVPSANAHATTIQPGDLAIQVRPGDGALKLTLRIRPANEPGGVDKVRAQSIAQAIATDPSTQQLIIVGERGASVELISTSSNQLQLLGIDGKVRNTFTTDTTKLVPQIVRTLWQHARQQALLSLRGDGGPLFSNEETLQVQLIPASAQQPCANGVWAQSPPNVEQVIPLCHVYQIRVSVAATSVRPLLVGGLLLYSDGAIQAFPENGRLERLEPGKAYTFPEQFQSVPPLSVREHLLIFGTQESNPVQWSLFAEPSATQDEKVAQNRGAVGALELSLERFMTPGMRGGVKLNASAENDESLWTSTYLPIRVEANTRFTTPDGQGTPEALKREYTIPSFDIRPYLPDDTQSALHRVLQKAHWMANARENDGIRYQQHDWSGKTDAENLARGIDCSRSIWFAYTRAGLKYNAQDRFLSTAEMVGPTSKMSDQFDSCQDDPNLQLGDILVYRDAGRKVGHVVMVIDAEKRIAWGSHGWDGNVKEQSSANPVPVDKGVEYQRIKYKKDWERWDRTTMQRVACWRYKQFVTDAASPGGRPGMAALNEPCEARSCQ